MTDGQYRAIVAYLNFWPARFSKVDTGGPLFDLDAAIRDIGITDDRAGVIDQLRKAGHDYDEKTGRLHYDD